MVCRRGDDLLGYEVERAKGQPTNTLGLFSIPGAPTDEGGALGAMRYFEKGGGIPLMAKAERKSTVHRGVPLDLVVIPVKAGDAVTGIGVHAGLWTSEALRVPPGNVPVLRARLKELDKDFGFDPKGHSGKALRHAVCVAAARPRHRYQLPGSTGFKQTHLNEVDALPATYCSIAEAVRRAGNHRHVILRRKL